MLTTSSVGGVGGLEREFDGHELGLVEPVPVLDRVDHRLADGDAHPVDGVLVEPRQLTQVIAHRLESRSSMSNTLWIRSRTRLRRSDMKTASNLHRRFRTVKAEPPGEDRETRVATGRSLDDRRGFLPHQSAHPSGWYSRPMHSTEGTKAVVVPATKPIANRLLRVPGDKSISHRYAILVGARRRRVPHRELRSRARIVVPRSRACARSASPSQQRRQPARATRFGSSGGVCGAWSLPRARSRRATPDRRCG